YSVSDVAFADAVIAYLGYREGNSAREYRFVALDSQRSQSQIRCAKIESESRCAGTFVPGFDRNRNRFRRRGCAPLVQLRAGGRHGWRPEIVKGDAKELPRPLRERPGEFRCAVRQLKERTPACEFGPSRPVTRSFDVCSFH